MSCRPSFTDEGPGGYTHRSRCFSGVYQQHAVGSREGGHRGQNPQPRPASSVHCSGTTGSGSNARILQDIQVFFCCHRRSSLYQPVGARFSAEYRKLSCLREVFPNTSIHGYTATATPQVRNDIVEQLKLRVPEVLVGSFDGPAQSVLSSGASQ